MCDTYENYIGRTIRNGRLRLGLNVNDVCYGICSVAVYSKIERGEYAGGIHVLRALCQRLGINQDRCGVYLAKAEYDDLMNRMYILEDIKDGKIDRAEERLACYERTYKNIPLNSQFVSFMRGRLAELKLNNTEALEYYENAVKQTMPWYPDRQNISCLTIYEAYMIFGVARIKARLHDETAAYKLYRLLLNYCMNSNIEKWILVCIYPKAVCEIIDIIGIDKMGIRGVNDMLEHCENALNMLVDTSRLHYIRSILRNIISFKCRLGNNDDNIKDYKELLDAIEKLFDKYGHERELFEWYPYYVDCGFYCVNELIAERRSMRGISIEELAGFKYSEIGKYKYFIKHERMILSVYIDCFGKMEKYEAIPDYDKMTSWIPNELSKKQFASAVENLNMRYANWYGNAGRYEESDGIAEEGIRIEIECERMHCLNILLYCRAWNAGKRGNVSENDKELCRCAYEIAKFKKQNARMELYSNWLEKHI